MNGRLLSFDIVLGVLNIHIYIDLMESSNLVEVLLTLLTFKYCLLPSLIANCYSCEMGFLKKLQTLLQ